jgi:type I restriction enzyme, S subunit
VTKNIPKQLPLNWAQPTLDQFGHLYCGQSSSVAEVNQDGLGMPYVTGPEQWDGNQVIKNKWTEYPRRIVPEGCIFITVKGAGVGKMFPGIHAAIGRDIYAFKPHSEMDFDFVFFAIKHSINAVVANAQGDIPGLSKSHILDHAVAIPGYDEQCRISASIEELFSELDRGIDNLRLVLEQLKVYRQAVLKHAFEGKLTARWRTENKGKLESAEQLLTRINALSKKKSRSFKAAESIDLPEIPAQWLYSRLENLGDLGRGKSKHRPRNDPKLFGGKYPFIQTGDVKAAIHIISGYSQTYSDFGLQQSKLWPAGTLCITIAANIAETAFLGFDSCFPDSIVGFSAKKELVLLEYVDLFIKSVKARIEAYAPATAQKNINLDTLENLIVPVCSLKEQKVIVEHLENAFSIIHELEKEIEKNIVKAESLRQTILTKAFSGELSAQNPNDESASILLERIYAEKTSSKPIAKKTKEKRKAA